VSGRGGWFAVCASRPARPYAEWVSDPAQAAAGPVPAARPAAGTAHVWWARTADASSRLADLLDPIERERWAAYRRDADRARFVVGCALAKTVLGAALGRVPAKIRFDRTCPECGRPHGKPALSDADLQFSVAHSGHAVAVAVALAPVGVDVEQLSGRPHELGGGDPAALSRRVLAEAEQRRLDAVDPADRPRAFLAAWARKEAVTKAKGDGLRVPFSEVIVAAGPGAPRVDAWPYPDDPAGVSILDLDPPAGYVAALAVLGHCDTVRPRDGSALLSGPGMDGGR
jgi:4'-phosphopantetheinyl transferase